MLTLFVVVLVLAVFCAAFVTPTVLFWQATTSLTLVVLMCFTWLALLSRSRNPFALGFAVTGWIYFVLVFSILVLPETECLPTNWVLEEFAHALHEDLTDMEGPIGAIRPIYTSSLEADEEAKYHRFENIGHCLWTLIFATIGGLATTWLARRENSPPPPTPKSNLDQP